MTTHVPFPYLDVDDPIRTELAANFQTLEQAIDAKTSAPLARLMLTNATSGFGGDQTFLLPTGQVTSGLLRGSAPNQKLATVAVQNLSTQTLTLTHCFIAAWSLDGTQYREVWNVGGLAVPIAAGATYTIQQADLTLDDSIGADITLVLGSLQTLAGTLNYQAYASVYLTT